MPTWMPRPRTAWRGRSRVVLLACTGLLSGLGMACWAGWLLSAEPALASASPRASAQDMPAPWAPRATTPPQASRSEALAFDHDCLRLMRERLFRQAFRACGAYLAHPTLSGRAHTALSALYTDPGHLDTEASVRHALQALALDEPRARILMAAHLMAGHLPPQGHDLIGLLKVAEAGRIPTANAYLQALRDNEQCRREASAMPLGKPLFCLSRAEVHQALAQQGMPLRRRDDLHWQDDFATGDVLADASAVRAQFDLDPRDSIHRLARLIYVFGNANPERRQQLAASLTRRYGAAAPSSAAAGESSWTLPDGVVIRLQVPQAEGTSLIYEHGQRFKGRQEHLQSQQAQIDLDRVKADASVL